MGARLIGKLLGSAFRAFLKNFFPGVWLILILVGIVMNVFSAVRSAGCATTCKTICKVMLAIVTFVLIGYLTYRDGDTSVNQYWNAQAATQEAPGGHVPRIDVDVAVTAQQLMFTYPDVDVAATALQLMVDNPDARPAFSSGCELPPLDASHVAACNAYKAAFEAKYGNPCRHNDEGAAVCLH